MLEACFGARSVLDLTAVGYRGGVRGVPRVIVVWVESHPNLTRPGKATPQSESGDVFSCRFAPHTFYASLMEVVR